MAEQKTINGPECGAVSSLSAARAERPKKAVPPALAKHAFRPGQSGNPGGRTPLFVECQAMAREASPEAMRRLIELIDSGDERVALMAADKVLERAWGKPRVMDEDQSPFKNMTREERSQRVLELLAFAAKLQVPEEIEVEKKIEESAAPMTRSANLSARNELCRDAKPEVDALANPNKTVVGARCLSSGKIASTMRFQ